MVVVEAALVGVVVVELLVVILIHVEIFKRVFDCHDLHVVCLQGDAWSDTDQLIVANTSVPFQIHS